jgi:hypothetical protein
MEGRCDNRDGFIVTNQWVEGFGRDIVVMERRMLVYDTQIA